MVSANFRDVAGEVRDIAMQTDFRGLAGVGLAAGIVGGIITDTAAETILPMAGFSAQPSTTTGLAVSGVFKWVVALVMGFAAVRLGRGTVSNVLAVSALGPAVTGAVDIGDALGSAGVPFLSTQAPRRQFSGTNIPISTGGGGGASENEMVQNHQSQMSSQASPLKRATV